MTYAKIGLKIEEFVDRERGWPLWIRWWDHPRRAGSARAHSPTVRVRLDRLPLGTRPEELTRSELTAHLNGPRDRDGSLHGGCYATVDAGYVPMLRIGDVYVDGIYIAPLPLETRTFTFPPDTSVLTERAQRTSPALRPDWFKHPWLTLSKSVYPKGNEFADSYLTTFVDRTAGRSLVLPNPEVFRTFYASSSFMSRRLLEGPWPLSIDRVVNLAADRTGWFDGAPRIGLRPGILDEEAPYIYMLALDPFGRQCANRIDERLRVGNAGVRPPGDRAFRVDLPFELKAELKICVEGFRPYPTLDGGKRSEGGRRLDHFVSLRVRSWNWPFDLSEINVWRDNSGDQGRDPRTEDGDAPYAHARRGAARQKDGAVATDPVVDAADRVMTEIIRSEGAGIIGRPRITHVEKPTSVTRRPTITRMEEELRDVSVSEPAPGGTALALDAKATERESTFRMFDSFVDMLDAARDVHRSIEEWHALTAPADRSTVVDKRVAWTFPDRPDLKRNKVPWHLLASRENETLPALWRGALVASVLVDKAEALVIMTELRDGTAGPPREPGYQSATVTFEGPPEAAARAAITLCGAGQGVWPNTLSDAWHVGGILGGSKWKHLWIGPDPQTLNPKPFQRSLRDLGIAREQGTAGAQCGSTPPDRPGDPSAAT